MWSSIEQNLRKLRMKVPQKPGVHSVCRILVGLCGLKNPREGNELDLQTTIQKGVEGMPSQTTALHNA